MRMNHVCLFTAASLFLSTGSATASSVTAAGNIAGTTWYVDNISTWASNGNTISGLSVTATFSNGFSQTISWVANSGAVGAGWSLTMPNPNKYGVNGYTDNTWYHDAYWNLVNSRSDGASLTSLVLDGQPGKAVFDVYSGRNEPGAADPLDTLSSDYGRYIIGASDDGSSVSAAASYSNLVALTGFLPVGDLYQTLTLNFTDFVTGGAFRFALDTDNVNDTPVPEPATLILFGTGLAGLASLRRKKKILYK